MANPKDILVITTSSIDGIKVMKYLKPVSAHIVAGTNLFNDFLGGLSDVFGGRSQTYQKQLTSIYNEAIERIKIAAHEVGANCILGLSIDMDEISGKGKSMFMVTAVGTAVVFEKESADDLPSINLAEKFQNIAMEKINILRTKKRIIESANSGELVLDDEVWEFLTNNKVSEVFNSLLRVYADKLLDEMLSDTTIFYKHFVSYIESLPEDVKKDLLYNAINPEKNEKLALRLSQVINELNLFDFGKTMQLLKSDDLKIQKMGLRICQYDKPFYNKQDIMDLQLINKYIADTFMERGIRTTKKQLLSSKERELWTCECGKTNELNSYCGGCYKDIYGFKSHEIKPAFAIHYIQEKIELINAFLD